MSRGWGLQHNGALLLRVARWSNGDGGWKERSGVEYRWQAPTPGRLTTTHYFRGVMTTFPHAEPVSFAERVS